MWNMTIQTIMQGYMLTCYKSVLGVRQIIDGQISILDDYVSPVLTLIYFVIAFGAYQLLKRFDDVELAKKSNLDSFGALYDTLRYHYLSPHEALWWPSIYLMNRFIFCFAAIITTSFAWLQITILIASQLYLCAYLAEFYPFESVWLNRLELFNNMCMLYSLYWLYIFANLTPDPTTQYTAAETLNKVLYAILGINVIVTAIMSYIDYQRSSYLL